MQGPIGGSAVERGGVSAGDFATEVLAGLALVGLAATRLHSFLLFHSLAEVFSVVVACGTFMVVWNARRFIVNSYVMFVVSGKKPIRSQNNPKELSQLLLIF